MEAGKGEIEAVRCGVEVARGEIEAVSGGNRHSNAR